MLSIGQETGVSVAELNVSNTIDETARVGTMRGESGISRTLLACVSDPFSELISEGFLEILVYPDILHELVRMEVA